MTLFIYRLVSSSWVESQTERHSDFLTNNNNSNVTGRTVQPRVSPTVREDSEVCE